MTKSFYTIIFYCLCLFNCAATISLPSIISNNMVLKSDCPIPIWGRGTPGDTVTVTFAEQDKSTTVRKSGKWRVILDPIPTSATPGEMVIASLNPKPQSITIKNILVGEVWLCSGQSNMQFSVAHAKNASTEIKTADKPEIRLFKCPMIASENPLETNGGKWVVCSPETVKTFSAVGYFFGREIHNELKCPVGLIQAAWRGSSIEAWHNEKTLKENHPWTLAFKKRRLARVEKEFGIRSLNFDTIQKDDENYKKLLKSEGYLRGNPTCLYNGMIAPISPFAITGTIWYQGEANVSFAYFYRNYLRELICSWRREWTVGDFPFYIVQLTNWDSPLTLAYAELRESQAAVLDEPNTGMAVAVDIGEADNIHPKNKQDVGKRLSRIALAKHYGKDIEYSGPVYKSMKIEGNKIRLKFTHIDGGLVSKGDKLKGFSIAAAKEETILIPRRKNRKPSYKLRKFYPAQAKIDGDTVLVWNDEVKNPGAVRYNWANAPDGNLYNQSGLPAPPFRTDNWPGITFERCPEKYYSKMK